MLLRVHERGPSGGPAVVCVHGLAQHGGVFEDLAATLARAGFRSLAVDLRGHGDSGHEPPWSIAAHLEDLLETAASRGVEAATWIGHSFGGVLVATLAARFPERVTSLVLLDPGFGITPGQALAGVERDRLDWSFATPEGAANALASSEAVVATSAETIADYVAGDLVRGPDGRWRFRCAPGALVVAWSELAAAPPPVAALPTLLVRPVASAAHSREQDLRYRRELGSALKMAVVPNGHNVLWEAPAETEAAITDFLAARG